MAEKNRVALKSYFETGDRPTQQQFADLIDSFVSRLDDSFVATLPDASTAQKGVVQCATTGEVQAGINTQHYVTPEGARIAAQTFAPVASVNGLTGNVNLTIPVIQDSGWVNAILLNGFANYGGPFAAARYRKKLGVVYLEGAIRLGGNGVVLAQLPVGYRPASTLSFIVATNTTAYGHIQITSGGDVVGLVVNTAFTSLSGISFVVD